MEVFSCYFITIMPYIQLFLCFYRVCFAVIYIFQRDIKSQRRFSNAGAGYTFYPLSTLIPIFKVTRGQRILKNDFFCTLFPEEINGF